MPRRLPEKTRSTGRRPRRFKRRYGARTPLFHSAPVKVGQELEVLIDDIGSRGDGIARIMGYLIFVPEAKIGERLKVRIIKVGRKFAVAEKQA
jgi:predicted RNA-binding protein with TRAM domain